MESTATQITTILGFIAEFVTTLISAVFTPIITFIMANPICLIPIVMAIIHFAVSMVTRFYR